MVGGCCGTTPAHIKALSDMAKTMDIPEISDKKERLLSSERMTRQINLDGSFMVVGERINPTGKKKLQAELREGVLDTVMTMAEEQMEKGASILDINVGMNGIDEKEMMVRVVYEVSQAVNLPLCIDSSNPAVIEAALRIYPGRALVNSVSLEKVKMQATLTFACMNLKKLAIWKHRKRLQKPSVHGKNGFFEKINYKLLYKAKIWQRVWITRCHICLQSGLL